MKKKYEKPEVETISLVTAEKITDGTDFGGMEGEEGVESNTLFD